jgi:hypothetical protein
MPPVGRQMPVLGLGETTLLHADQYYEAAKK